MRLIDDLDILDAAVSRAHEQTGIPARQIRKDFWITEALRGCVEAAKAAEVTVVFKGGTSLSKVFGTIERFSEDVDLLVIGAGGKAALNTAMKELARGAEERTGVEAVLDVRTVQEGAFRAYRLAYPGRPPEDQGVLLEIGARGGALPHATHQLVSIVAPVAAALGYVADEAEPFDVRVLDPARTLVEKLVILHEAHQRTGPGRSERIRKVARHYYDVWCLLGDPDVVTSVQNHGTAVLAREVCQHSKAIGLPAVTYPKGGFGMAAAFTESHATEQRTHYRAELPDLMWPHAEPPTFQMCLERIAEYSAIL